MEEEKKFRPKIKSLLLAAGIALSSPHGVEAKGLALNDGVTVGIVPNQTEWELKKDVIAASEINPDKPTAVVATYVDFRERTPELLKNILTNIDASGATPMVTIEPGDAEDWKKEGYSLQSIVNGEHDVVLKQYAKELGQFGKPALVRFAHEMNDWGGAEGAPYPWVTQVSPKGDSVPFGNTPEDYVKAYKHVADILRSEPGAQPIMVWCPDRAGNIDMEMLKRLYPDGKDPNGKNYVDVVGMDGYSWSWKPESFTDIFKPLYTNLRQLFPDKPVMVAETGADINPSNPNFKNEWYENMFRNEIPQSFPNLSMVVLFNRKDTETPADLRVPLDVVRAVTSSPLYK